MTDFSKTNPWAVQPRFRSLNQTRFHSIKTRFVDLSAHGGIVEVRMMRRYIGLRSSARAAVEVVDETETEAAVTERTLGLRSGTIGQPVVQPLMWTASVVVLDIGLDEIAQLPLSKHDEPVPRHSRHKVPTNRSA